MKKNNLIIVIIIGIIFVVSCVFYFGFGRNKVKVVKNEEIVLEEYKNNEFSMKKPKGWVVETAGSGMFYSIKVYDPNEKRNQIFLLLKAQPLLKSDKASALYKNYYKLTGNNPSWKLFSEAIVLNKPTVLEFYKSFNKYSEFAKSIEPTYSNFNFPVLNDINVIEEYPGNGQFKNIALDDKIIRISYNNEESKSAEGMFKAAVVNFGNTMQGGTDIGYYMVYDIAFISSVKDEFTNYQSILADSFKTIEFNDEYVKKTIDDGNAQTKASLELNASIQRSFESYMSAWESRSKTYDIMSQKQSDQILGYERVYDTDTNEIYKAYNGFTDDYKGNKYKSVTDDMYLNKTNGYIEK